MSPADRRRWGAARSLADLGGLTALWLEGKIASQPGYQPYCGPDEETRELVSALAAACRAGYVTTSSQPGCIEYDKHGSLWRQQAAVEGFVDNADLLQRLLELAARGGYTAVVHSLKRAGDFPDGIVVTTRDGKPVTSFGCHLTGRLLRTLYPASIHSEAFAAVRRAWQVTLIDPSFGDSRLFAGLHEVVTPAPAGPHYTP